VRYSASCIHERETVKLIVILRFPFPTYTRFLHQSFTVLRHTVSQLPDRQTLHIDNFSTIPFQLHEFDFNSSFLSTLQASSARLSNSIPIRTKILETESAASSDSDAQHITSQPTGWTLGDSHALKQTHDIIYKTHTCIRQKGVYPSFVSTFNEGGVRSLLRQLTQSSCCPLYRHLGRASSSSAHSSRCPLSSIFLASDT
jgi:hypothetical protein